MSSNVFQRLRNLLPEPAVLVGTVTAIDSSNGSSTVQFPGASALIAYASNVATGPLVRVRGTTVAVGKRAFVRAGVIESQAPDGDVIEIPIGQAVPVVGGAAAVPLSLIARGVDLPDITVAAATAPLLPATASATQTDAPDMAYAALGALQALAAEQIAGPDAALATASATVAVLSSMTNGPDVSASAAQSMASVFSSAADASDVPLATATLAVVEPTWSMPSNLSATWALSNGGLTVTAPGGTTNGTIGTTTAQTSGKRYFEVLLGGSPSTGLPYAPAVGVINQTFAPGSGALIGSATGGWGFGGNGSIYSGGNAVASGLGTHAAGQVLMFALDFATLKFWVGRNGTWAAGGSPAAGTGQQTTVSGTAFRPGFCANAGTQVGTLRTVAAEFAYAPPTGFAGWGE